MLVIILLILFFSGCLVDSQEILHKIIKYVYRVILHSNRINKWDSSGRNGKHMNLRSYKAFEIIL